MTDTLSLSAQTIQEIQNGSSIGVKDIFNIVFLFINAGILLVTIYVIRKSPIDAIKIGRQLNDSQLKDKAKLDLFFTLFSYRGSPVDRNFVDALNRIDIVFYDTQDVLSAWHKLFDSLHIQNQVNKEETWRLLRTELLSKMSLSLGYNSLAQYDIEKHYYPEGHKNQNRSDFEFRVDRQEFYRSARELNLILIDRFENETQQIDENNVQS